MTDAALDKKRLDIQGLRALAVAAVVMYHVGIPFLPGGYVGVDVFFVISGFLITGHLAGRLRKTGRLSLADFYAKRVRRVLPASFAVLVLSLLAALAILPPLQVQNLVREAIATALYVPNLLFAAQGTDYLAETTPSVFQHYWSLGVEEQFYLLWPILLILAFSLRRPRPAFIVATVLALSFVAGVVVMSVSQPWAFFSVATRAWEFGVGGLIAFIPARWRFPTAAAVLAWLGLAGIVAALMVYNESTSFPGFAALLPVLATAAVIAGGSLGAERGPETLLRARPLQFLGLISYSIYLVHWPPLVLAQAAAGYDDPLPLWFTVAIGAASVPGGYLLFRFVEDPARSAPWLTRSRARRSLGLAVAASVLSVAIAGGGAALSARVPLDAGQEATPVLASAQVVGTTFVPSNLSPSLRQAADDNPRLYADGCHADFASTDPTGCVFGDPDLPAIVLFGDSHAAQWFPAVQAFADRNGYRVETHTKSSCPSVDIEVSLDDARYASCAEWRRNVVDKLERDRPTLVILANYGRAPLWQPPVDYGAAWSQGLSRTIRSLESFSTVVVMADTPDLGQVPSVCLSAHLDDAAACGRRAAEALDSPARAAEARAAEDAGVQMIDMTRYLCSADTCPPIIGSTLVYRDAHHITATFSARLADALGERLIPLLPR